MRIIITGAAGFIGSNLSGSLLDSGHEVVGIDDFSYGSKENIAHLHGREGFEFLEADLMDEKVLKSLKGDVIVHLASQKIPRYTNAKRVLDDNYIMTGHVIQKCLDDKIKIVFASTSDVYGKNPDVPYDEESNMVLGPTTVKRWAYALSKMYSEHKIIAYHDEFGLDYTIVRFFGSYGPNQNLTWWGGPQSVFIDKALKQDEIEVHGTGKQTRTFTFVEDTVQGLQKCTLMEEALNDIFNIASEPTEEVTIHDLALLIWDMIHEGKVEPKIKLIPYETFGKYEDVMRRVPVIDKIKTKLGFLPQYSLRDGMAKTIAWQRARTGF